MKTIEITTTQKVTIEYELAGLRDRFLAFLIDLLALATISFILMFILRAAFINEIIDDKSDQFIYYIPILVFILYNFISELVMNGQTIGKKVVGIKVIKLNGKEAAPSDYFLRAIFHFIDTFFSVFVLGAIMVLSTDKSQRLGDLAANTAVIKVKFNLRFRLEDIMKINSLTDYEPQYPDVRQFSEEDMLLIKSVVARHRQFGNISHRNVVNELVRDLMLKLDIVETPRDKIHFLKTLIRDYIVLTR